MLTATAIVAAGYGVTAPGPGDWPVFIGRQPTGPDSVLTVYDTGGTDPLHLEAGLRRPTVQVRVRSVDYADGWTKANAIYAGLGTTWSAIYGAERVVGFVARGDILFLNRDDQDRFLFSLNFELMRDQS